VVREAGPLAERVAAIRHDAGAVLGPFEAWLLLRGMRTLYLRVKASCANAAALAEFLAGHPAVERVLYPGLADFTGHDVATRQMQGGFGGMVSVCLNGGAQPAIDVAARLQVFKRATSLGGVESLVEHRASIEGPDTPTPDNLLRLSVGIEDIDDLIADFAQALDG
jgi:cystathionine gamma-synthase